MKFNGLTRICTVVNPVIGKDGTVYDGSDDGNLYALNGSTGTVLWKVETGELSSSLAIASDGTLYVGSDTGMLYAIQ